MIFSLSSFSFNVLLFVFHLELNLEVKFCPSGICALIKAAAGFGEQPRCILGIDDVSFIAGLCHSNCHPLHLWPSLNVQKARP